MSRAPSGVTSTSLLLSHTHPGGSCVQPRLSHTYSHPLPCHIHGLFMSHTQAPQDPHRYTHLSCPSIFPSSFTHPPVPPCHPTHPPSLSPRTVPHTVHTRPFPGQPLLRTSPGREVQKLPVGLGRQACLYSFPSPNRDTQTRGNTPAPKGSHHTPLKDTLAQKGPTPLIRNSPPHHKDTYHPLPPSPSHRRQSSQPQGPRRQEKGVRPGPQLLAEDRPSPPRSTCTCQPGMGGG